MDEPYVIAGLGNPGKEYADTRHNAGFMAVALLRDRWQAVWEKAPAGLAARLARAARHGRRIWLCQPRTFMNASGEAVAPLLRYLKAPLSKLLVIVDDADLPLGEIRLRPGGGSGGHHGLESIEQELGTRQYARLRVGIIGRSGAPGGRQITGEVLGRFGAEEKAALKLALDQAARQAECWIAEGIQAAMNKFNGAVSAPPAKG